MAVRMWRSGMYREYPMFCWFVYFDIVRSVVDFILSSLGKPAYAAYFYTYWIADAISIVLAFAVMWELFKITLRPYEGMRDLAAVLFRWAIVVLLLVAVVMAASQGHGAFPRSYWLVQAVMVLERSVRMVQAGLMLLLLLFGAQLAINWRHTAFGIALGFAVYAVLQLAAFAIRLGSGLADGVFKLLSPISYLLALLIWAAYLWHSKPLPAVRELPPGSDLARWNTALLEVLQR